MILFCCFDFALCRENRGVSERLILRALECFDKGSYKESLRLFTKFNDQFPYDDRNASIACLKMADAYFELRQYDSAIEMYEYFESMYPRDKSIPHAIYRVALSYFNQLHGIENDNECIKMALANCVRFLDRFPEDKLVSAVRAKMDDCYEMLSGYEFAIGIFYYKKGNYSSALSRFSRVIFLYPDLGYHRKALLYLVNCERLLN